MSIYYEKCEMGNDLEFSDELLENILQILVQEASDDFWKILKYGATDALVNPSYTISEQDKLNMIKQNNINSETGEDSTRVKVKKFNDDISTVAHNEIRIFDGSWTIPSVNDYNVAIGVEIISHNSLVTLDKVGKRTINVLRHEIYRIFNNAYVSKNISKLTNLGTRGNTNTFNKSYQGYQFSLTSLSA